tara:strand:+ start:7704 stop:8414 length:711 start_codon:yes stop_codon:yes gene_type:complete
MINANIGLLAVDSLRTRAYLSSLIENGIHIKEAILLENGSSKVVPSRNNTQLFDSNSSALEVLEKMSTNITLLDTSNINDQQVEKSLVNSNIKLFIYSGSGGAIIKSNILNTQKQFLHIHPGYLPDYRGSTTIYYSLLQDQSCGAAAILLDKNIDTGPIVLRRRFNPPTDWSTIDNEYDPYIRSQLLLEVITEYVKNKELPPSIEQNPEGYNYYIMHPLLRHLTILSQITTFDTEA